MGSDSDMSVMEGAVEALREFGVPFEVRVLSAHRTPDDALAAAAGLEPVARFATWERAPYTAGDYAVSVHRKAAVASPAS